MSKVLKIGQISDIHIGNGEELVQGIDVCANFRSALESGSMKNLDLLVLSGDLAENAEAGAYEYVASLLKDYKSPWCVIPGNHDNLDLMKKYFDLDGKVSGDRCFYRYDLEGKSIFFLEKVHRPRQRSANANEVKGPHSFINTLKHFQAQQCLK